MEDNDKKAADRSAASVTSEKDSSAGTLTEEGSGAIGESSEKSEAAEEQRHSESPREFIRRRMREIDGDKKIGS
jgi:hypothetical protein